jgi:acylphosphatase
MATLYKRFLVSGRVQGVFYRDSARHLAKSLGLYGWVRNLADGRVELLASGEEQAVETLEKWLEIGPEYAKVTNIEVIIESPVGLTESFEIWPTTSLSN